MATNYDDAVNYYNDLFGTTNVFSFNNSIYTTEGYATIQSLTDEQFAQISPQDIVDVTNVDMAAVVTQSNPKKPFQCNFSFNFSFNLKINLPNINPNDPDMTLLYKIDEMSKEFAKMNDILINAIRSMNCCDIEDAYNHTVVPIFRWFADHPDIKNCSPDQDPTEGNCGPIFGDTLPYLMLKIAKTLIQIYIVARPLACLLRPLPGNPWWPADFDPVKWIYGFLDFFDMYVDLIINGKILDEYIVKPIRKVRQNLQHCITGTSTYQTTDHEKVLENTMKITSLNKQISLLDSKIYNLQKDQIRYNDKFNHYAHDVKIIIQDNDGNLLDEKDFLTIITQFSVIYKNNTIDWESKCTNIDPILNNIQIFLDNINNQNILCNFIKSYYPAIDGTIETLEYNLTNVQIINTNNITYNVNDSLLNDPDCVAALNVWQSIFQSLFYYAQELYSYRSLYLQVTNQIKTYNDIKKQLENYIKEISSTLIKDNTSGITSEQILKAAYRNIIAKTGQPGNICNCLIYSIFDDPKQPAIYKINTFLYNDMEKFLDKEAWFWKLGDVPDVEGVLAEEMYPDLQTKKKQDKSNNTSSTENTDIKDLPLFFSSKFLKDLDSENRNILDKLISKYTSLIKNNEINLVIQELQNENIKSIGTASDAFLKYLDTKVNKEYYLVPDYSKWTEGVDLYNPYTESMEESYNLLKFDINWMPQSMYPSEYYTKYMLPLYAFLSSLKKIYPNLDSEYNAYIYTPDINNFKKAKNKAEAVLNTINILLEIETDATTIIKLKEYQLKARKVYDAFFGQYHPIDVVKDPNEFYIRSYENLYLSDEDYIESKLGTGIAQIINTYIAQRKELFTKYIEVIYAKSYYEKFITDLKNYIYDNGIFSDLTEIWVLEPANLPCDCSIFCKIIQYIINLLLAALSKILNTILNAIIDWLLNTWIGKLIKIILQKIKCIIMAFRVSDDLDKLENLTDTFIEALKQRIKLYVDPSICALTNLTNQTTTNVTEENDPETELQQLINDTLSDVGTQETTPPYDPEQNPNFNLSQPQINIDPDTGEISINLQIPPQTPLYQPAFQNQITNGLPAKLILSDGVQIGAVNPDTNFPILNFDCNCLDDCVECHDENKYTNTLNFLNS